MTSVQPPPVVRRHRRRRSGPRWGRIGLAVVVVAALAWVLWAMRPASDLIDGVAGPTEVESTRLAEAEAEAEAEAVLVPSTVPSTTTTTVPDVIVGPLEAKGKPVPVVFRIGTFDPVVFITIDDGGIQRPELVEYIRQTGIPVTMFLTERYTSGDGVAYFRELQDLGATVQAHSITHTSLRGKPLDLQTDEVCGPVDTYERNYGERPRYFRPPYGNYDTNTLLAAQSCGLKAVLWWSATYDSGTLRLQEGPLRRGEIILMHFNDHLTQDLQLLMQEVEAAGLRPALLDDYLDAAPVLP